MQSQITTTKGIRPDSVKAYTRQTLKIYDALIMGFVVRWVWRCPPEVLISFYDGLVSHRHVDIGVGTGYCLDRCKADIRRLALVDLNTDCLEHTRHRLRRYSPTTHVRDVRAPMHIGDSRFDSVALGGVLHCLPGSMEEKGKVFDNLQPLISDQAVVFGYTLISDHGALSPLGHAARAVLNGLRFIQNYSDTSEGLQQELQQRFHKFAVRRVGAMAFFVASGFLNKGGEQRGI